MGQGWQEAWGTVHIPRKGVQLIWLVAMYMSREDRWGWGVFARGQRCE